MREFFKNFEAAYKAKAIIWFFMILGIYLLVIRTFGLDLGQIPGDLGDARFNNFVLEHFYRWVIGQEKSFWNAPIFYPYPMTIAFSDSLLGSAPFYFIFRWFGLSREAAFQGWYCLGFIFNYLAAIYVLSRLKLDPIAISAGAFFFTFGIPMLAQTTHAQLIYRFGVPLACYFLWKFTQYPRLGLLTLIGFWFVWQLYLSIYIGFFLFLLFIPFLCLLPLIGSGGKITNYFGFWPQMLKAAWSNATGRQRLVNIIGIISLLSAIYILISPYLWVSSHYGFTRSWWEIETMLPRLQSYFLADNAQLWQPISRMISQPPMVHEHQLFMGITVTLIVLIGVLWKAPMNNRRFAFYNLWAFCFLVVITLNIKDLSIYKLVFQLPGFSSIRAVSRIILVMMWPLAVFIAVVINQLMISSTRKFPSKTAAYFCILLIVIESVLFTQTTYSKIDGLNRLNTLRNQLVPVMKKESIVFIAAKEGEPWWTTEIDAMLLGQELSLGVLNGYSGNFPPGYGPASSCNQMQRRISRYLKFSNLLAKSDYLEIANRVIPIGFSDCDKALLGPASESSNP